MRFFLTLLAFINIAYSECVQKDCPPASTPCLKNETCFSLEGDFIYMKPKVDNLFFAVKNDEVISPKFEYSPGFKALIGFYFPRWTWDFVIRETVLESRSKKSVNSVLPLLWQSSIDETPLFQNANAHFNIKYSCLDIEVGKAISITSKIILRIHGGIRNTLITQKLKAIYKNSNHFEIDPNLNVAQSKNIFRNHSNGTGIRIGFDTKWQIGPHLSILADPSFSFMLTSFDMLQNYYNTLNNSALDLRSFSNLKYKEHIWVVRPNAQILLGLGYNRCFESFSLICKAGYEFNYFWEFNLNRRYHILANSVMNKGDLFLQGLVLGLGFDF